MKIFVVIIWWTLLQRRCWGLFSKSLGIAVCVVSYSFYLLNWAFSVCLLCVRYSVSLFVIRTMKCQKIKLCHNSQTLSFFSLPSPVSLHCIEICIFILVSLFHFTQIGISRWAQSCLNLGINHIISYILHLNLQLKSSFVKVELLT